MPISDCQLARPKRSEISAQLCRTMAWIKDPSQSKHQSAIGNQKSAMFGRGGQNRTVSTSAQDSDAIAITPHPENLVRQVRLELTIPCLRGRCLDPIWLLTHGGTERTRTVIGLVDNQVPHLSATVPNIADCQLPISNWPLLGNRDHRESCQSAIGNRKSKMLWVGRRELNPYGPQSQCGALPIELRPTQTFSIADF